MELFYSAELGWGYAAAPAMSVPYGPAVESQSEVEILKDQANYFGESLESINRRIAEIEKRQK